MIDDHDWHPDPTINGGSACRTLTAEVVGRVFGAPGARIRVRVKPRAIGFQLPRKSPAQGAAQ